LSIRKIFVTGGAGYFGSVLVGRLLEREDNFVYVLDALHYGPSGVVPYIGKHNYSFLRGDIRDSSLIKGILSQGIDCIVHLAALVGEPLCDLYPDLASSVNVNGTETLVNLANEYDVQHFIFASTCSNYGRQNDEVDEYSPLDPRLLYSKTKVMAEEYVMKHASYPTVLRFATLFGPSPRLRFDLLLNEIVYKALTEGVMEIYDPEAWRPLIQVRDASAAVSECISAGLSTGNEVFNVGAVNLRKIELAETVKKCVPEAKIKVLSGGKDKRSYKVSFSKVTEKLSFTPKISVEQGIRELTDHFRLVSNHKDVKYRNAEGFRQ